MADPKASDKAVTRIKASSSPKSKTSGKAAGKPTTKTTIAAKPSKIAATVASTKVQPKKARRQRRNPIAAFLGYFSGAWRELRQVRWPDRRATWSLTGAVLAFSAFFVVFILVLDAAFKYLFTVILK